MQNLHEEVMSPNQGSGVETAGQGPAGPSPVVLTTSAPADGSPAGTPSAGTNYAIGIHVPMTPGNVPAGLVQESADPEQMASGPAQPSLNLQHGTVGSADPETVEPRARIVSAKARQEAAKEKEEAKS